MQQKVVKAVWKDLHRCCEWFSELFQKRQDIATIEVACCARDVRTPENESFN